MKKIALILASFLTCSLAGLAQTNTSQANQVVDVENDKVTLFTDRNLYVAGELLYFASHINNSTKVNSRVLYVELISLDGRPIQASKYKIDNNKAYGALTIPKETPSGNYLVKAYTRWMRNFNQAEYSYTQILVVNPSNQTPLPPTTNGNGSEVRLNPIEQSDHPISISPNHNNYKPREIVTINIDTKGNDTPPWLCLTIAPKATLINQISIGNKSEYPIPDSIVFNAESKGFSLTANVQNAETNKPLAYSLVNISILGPFPDFLASRTDTTGFFSVALPEILGTHDLYIGFQEGENPKVKFDNDFCPRRVKVQLPAFSLSDNQYDAATNIINNQVIHNHFTNSDLDSLQSTVKHSASPFYGTPDVNFIFSNYVDLLSVREYFHELLPVSVKEIDGKTTFRIFGNYPEFDIYEPLILIDNVVIDDAKRILAANPKQLERVEIINKPYYKGNMVYGGIVSFFSKEGDFARIELSQSDMFISYKFFAESKSYKNQKIPEDKPDTRNTVLWVHEVDLSDGGAEHKFVTPDTKGEYEILLRGIDPNGNLILKKSYFEVH
jgi:hypothetical protein